MREVHPSRRAVLASAGALALSGCLGAPVQPEPQPDPDLRLRRRVAAEVDELVRAYAAATEAFPALTGRLEPLAAEHQAHAAALRGPRTGGSATSGAEGSATPPTGPAVPASRAATVTWLAGLERRAAGRRTRQAAAAGPDLARLLASVGACESVHAVLLGADA